MPLSLDDLWQNSVLMLNYETAYDSTVNRCIEVVESEWLEHRLYVSEVIELRSDVSIIVLLPAAHNICSAPGDVDLRHVATAVPLQIFEISEQSRYWWCCEFSPKILSIRFTQIHTVCICVKRIDNILGENPHRHRIGLFVIVSSMCVPIGVRSSVNFGCKTFLPENICMKN